MVYISQWEKEQGCKYPTFIDCMWIWNDRGLERYQKWLDKQQGDQC